MGEYVRRHAATRPRESCRHRHRHRGRRPRGPGGQPGRPGADPGRGHGPRVRRPPVQHGPATDPRRPADRPRRRRRPHRLRRPPLPHRRASARASFEDAFDDYLAFLEPRIVRGAARPPADGQLLPAPRLPRGALRQGPLRRDLRPRVLPQRDRLGVRLRRAHAPALAREARRHPRLRPGPGRATSSTPTRSTASRTWRPASSAPRRPRAASCRRTPGGTRSSAPPARRSSATPRRSRSASCGASSLASSPPGGVVLDFFAGSGTTGAAARELGRRFVLVDSSEEALAVMRRRFRDSPDVAFLDASGGEAGLEVGDEIARDPPARPTGGCRPSPMPSAAARLGCQARVRHDGRVLGERLDARRGSRRRRRCAAPGGTRVACGEPAPRARS